MAIITRTVIDDELMTVVEVEDTEARTVSTTTTFKPGPPDEPAKGLFRSRHPKLNFRMLKQLHAEHEKRKVALSKKLGATKAAPADLVAFARAVDEGVSRQLG